MRHASPRGRLQRRIFHLFGATIVAATLVAGALSHLAGTRAGGWSRDTSLVALVGVLVVLWVASGAIARKLARPIAEVARVAEEIGAGNLASRVRPPICREGHARRDEVAELASAINRMAERIERQFREQRELLATVSHEIRTPLARLRVLTELLRDGAANGKLLDDVEREIVEMDALVGELLANSRVEFAALTRTPLCAADIARRALERAEISVDRLTVEETVGAPEVPLVADATLLARALANLVENARAHGGGLTRLVLRVEPDRIAFIAEDEGPGLDEAEVEHVFEPFFRGSRASGERSKLGLGLALVRRIAEAHGGRAFAEPRPGGGARVGIELPVERDR